jgi:hypothetical protein
MQAITLHNQARLVRFSGMTDLADDVSIVDHSEVN